MRIKKSREQIAIILFARGYDEGFVNRCVGDLREAGIRTQLVGLTSQHVRSWHGVEIKADTVLRQLPVSEALKLVIIPGQPQSVSALAMEPLVPELVRHVLRQNGCVAVAKSAESFLERQKHELPTDMRIIPADICETQQLRQQDRADREFIRSLIQQLQSPTPHAISSQPASLSPSS